MIYVILWILTGLSVAAYWIYVDVTKENNAYNLKELLGMTLVSALLGPCLIGFLIHDKYKEQIIKFFNNPIVGRKE